MVRGKFKVSTVTHCENPEIKVVKLYAVNDDGIEENRRYSKYTPSGSIEMTINNPPAAAVFVPGADFYVDFTPIEK